jgi:hypothetical protein
LREQISILKGEISTLELKKTESDKKMFDQLREIENLRKEIEKLEEDNLQKDRENELICLSLER